MTSVDVEDAALAKDLARMLSYQPTEELEEREINYLENEIEILERQIELKTRQEAELEVNDKKLEDFLNSRDREQIDILNEVSNEVTKEIFNAEKESAKKFEAVNYGIDQTLSELVHLADT